MEKRVFLAIFLSFLILAIYQSYIVPPVDPAPPQSAANLAAPTGALSGNPAAPTGAGAAAPLGTDPVPAIPMAAPIVADVAARDIVVETDAVRAVFSTAGAVLKSWQLKRYLDPDGKPFELVPQDVPEALPRPFSLTTDDAALSAVLARALYLPSEPSLSLGSSPGTLSFTYRDESGLNARKTFHFQPEGKGYLLNVEAAVDVGAIARPVTLAWGPALGRGFHENGGQYIVTRAIVHRDGSVERLYQDDVLESPRVTGPFRYAGVEDHYFLTAVLKPETSTVEVAFTPVTLPPVPPATPDLPPGPERQFITLAVSTPGATTLPFYLGPKLLEELRAVDPQLALAIDFGVFAAIIVPLLQALQWIYGQVGNYGWAIIILTILINLAIFPLRHRSMVSMKKMQALQPAVKAIQERYAKYKLTDPERGKMNQEMMALYKQKGVNPASGCLPMLLTMPILFAFYSLLSVAIELRGAPFLGWITDLSAPDPSYISPILMGASMMLQQHMMPTTADPAQRRIFMMMPVMFTVMFLWFPSGLVIYWLVSNLMAIGQQLITNRIIDGPKPTGAVAGLGSGNKSAGKS